MNILTVGYALPNPAVDNYNVLTAPSYSDYDAIIVDPASITSVVAELLSSEREFRAMDDRPVVNGATTATAVSAAEQVLRRTDETKRLLEAGGLVVVIARPNAQETGLVGFEGCDRYSWLPAPAGAGWGPAYLRPNDGTTVRITADEHPFSTVLRETRRDVTHRAIIDEKLLAATENPTVIARGGSNVIISASFRVLDGLVVFVPATKIGTNASRTKMAKPFVEAVQWLLGSPEAENPPAWAKAMAIPGLEQIDAELDEAEKTAEEASTSAEELSESQRRLTKYRRLVWAEGSAFKDAVREALELLGFSVSSHATEALAMKAEDAQMFVESESSAEQVAEWPYIRLQRRLEERLLKVGSSPHGLVVVNGLRRATPSSRPKEFTDALRNACENYGYTLLRGDTLLAMVQRALGGSEDAVLTGIRRKLMSHAGLLDTDTALGEAEVEEEEEQQGAGPIF